jgi:hypothetical protein
MTDTDHTLLISLDEADLLRRCVEGAYLNAGREMAGAHIADEERERLDEERRLCEALLVKLHRAAE